MANLHVLVMGNGVMRTAREYRTLLEQAGFLPPNIIHTGGTVSFIETAVNDKNVTEE